MSETHKHSQTLPLPPAERGALDATASLPGGTGAEELALHAQVNGRKCETALVIMARYPEQGKGKTRLAHHLGDEATLSLYRAFLSDLAQRFAGWIYDLHWAYTPAEADFSGYAEALVPTRTAYMHSFSQRGPDLGARLHHAFRTTYARQFQRTVLIGSDAPQISRATIVQAEAALDTADVVLGPADDGGYYLIAMRQPHDVFTDVPMSTSIVLR